MTGALEDARVEYVDIVKPPTPRTDGMVFRFRIDWECIRQHSVQVFVDLWGYQLVKPGKLTIRYLCETYAQVEEDFDSDDEITGGATSKMRESVVWHDSGVLSLTRL